MKKSNCTKDIDCPCASKAYDRGYDDGFESGLVWREQEKNGVIPTDYSVSSWANTGKERGYWGYFKKEVAKELYDLLSEQNKGSWLRILNQFSNE